MSFCLFSLHAMNFSFLLFLPLSPSISIWPSLLPKNSNTVEFHSGISVNRNSDNRNFCLVTNLKEIIQTDFH